jgi:hypothetical protein
VYTDCYIVRYKPWPSKRYTTNWYQSEGFDTEPRWASGAVFGLRMRGEIESGGPISDPGLLRSVKETLDEFLLRTQEV